MWVLVTKAYVVVLFYEFDGLDCHATVLQRNLPRNYPYENVYSTFPLSVPNKQMLRLRDSQMEQLYDVNRPEAHPLVCLESKDVISYVFNKPQIFKTMYGENLKSLSNGYG